MVREGLADEVDDGFLGLEVGFRHRVNGAFQGDVLGFEVILPQHRARGQCRLPPHLNSFVQYNQVIIQYI
jgi:hypothetical protein